MCKNYAKKSFYVFVENPGTKEWEYIGGQPFATLEDAEAFINNCVRVDHEETNSPFRYRIDVIYE